MQSKYTTICIKKVLYIKLKEYCKLNGLLITWFVSQAVVEKMEKKNK